MCFFVFACVRLRVCGYFAVVTSNEPSAILRREMTYGDVMMCKRPVVDVPKKTTAAATAHWPIVAACSPMTRSGPPTLVRMSEKSERNLTLLTPTEKAPW